MKLNLHPSNHEAFQRFELANKRVQIWQSMKLAEYHGDCSDQNFSENKIDCIEAGVTYSPEENIGTLYLHFYYEDCFVEEINDFLSGVELTKSKTWEVSETLKLFIERLFYDFSQNLDEYSKENIIWEPSVKHFETSKEASSIIADEIILRLVENCPKIEAQRICPIDFYTDLHQEVGTEKIKNNFWWNTGEGIYIELPGHRFPTPTPTNQKSTNETNSTSPFLIFYISEDCKLYIADEWGDDLYALSNEIICSAQGAEIIERLVKNG